MPQIVKLQINVSTAPFLIPIQTLNHHTGRIECFELQLNKTDQLLFNITGKCTFLLTSLTDNGSRLYSYNAGNYMISFPPGAHRIIIITYSPDWFIYKCSLLPEIDAMADKGVKTKNSFNHPIRMGKILWKAFQKINNMEDLLKRDRACYLLINDSVNEYHRRLKSKAETIAYNQQKAAAIAEFIIENYALEIVEDRRKMADRFMVSERHLDRLAKGIFGKPLHAQVIKYRMESGLDQLLNTKKPIYEIAERTGYREAYYFSKAFKNYFGFPPSNLTKV